MDTTEQKSKIVSQENQKQSAVSAEEKITFYTDPKGIFMNAPPRLQKVLKNAEQEGDVNIKKIKFEDLCFEKKETGNNFCSHFFAASVQKYYVCDQCSYSLGGFSTMCYCGRCFDPTRHIGHNYYDQIPYSDRAYCDCGRLQRFKKQSFCQHHQGFDVQMVCQISVEEEKQFIQCFSGLIQIGLDKQDSEWIIKIGLQLEKLNQNSVYYNRMTFKLLTSLTKSKKEQIKNKQYFFLFGRYGFDFQKLMIHLGGDLRTRMNMIKFFSQQYAEDPYNQNMSYFSSSNWRQLINITAVEKLVQEGFSHQFMYQTIKNQPSAKKYPQLIAKLLINKIKDAKDMNQLQNFKDKQIQQFTVDLAELILFKTLQLYPSSQQITKFIKGQSNESQNPWSKFQQIQNTEQVAENLLPSALLGNKLIIKCVSAIIASDLQLAKDIRTYLFKKGVNPEKLEQVLYWIIVTSKQNFYFQGSEGNPFGLITLLLLIRESPSKMQHIERLWSYLLKTPTTEQNQGEEYQSKIPLLADVFHFIITVIFRTDIFCIREKKKFSKFNKTQDKNVNSPSQDNALRQWFRSFLYQRKAVSRSQIIQLKTSGILNFSGAGKILNQLCSYNEEQQIFNFAHSSAFKNIINEFPLIPTRENFESLYNNTIHYGQEIKFEQNSLAYILLNELLSCKTIIPILEKQWEKTTKHDKYSQSEEKIGYLYLFMLVVYDILTKGFNQSIKQKIEAIRKDESLLSIYSCKEQDTNLIKRLLNISQTPEQKESPTVQNKSEKRALAEEKKKKIAQKFKKTRELVLEKIKSQTEGQMIDQDEELCILCHEKQKKNNFLVYLSIINKNNTICGSVHGKNNISNTYVGTCFHAVHVNCFIQFRKNSGLNFNCPLCQTQSNCITPIQYNPQNTKLNRICQNAMIASMVTSYHIYDIQSDFILIFKHLVESKGLNSLLQDTRYEQKKKQWQKNDEFLLSLMQNIYDHSSEENKKRHLTSIKQFVEQIQACPKLECKLIQLLFAQALKAVLTSPQSYQNIQKLLLKIRGLIKQEQFLIIQEQLSGLFHQEAFTKLPEPAEDELKQQKVSLSFSLIRLEQKANECLNYFKNKKCGQCQNQDIQYCCLICGKILCGNCKDDHSSSAHNQTTIYFIISTFRVECVRNNYYSDDDIYENQFKVGYSQRNNEEEEMNNIQDYFLNQLKFQKIINKFLQN